MKAWSTPEGCQEPQKEYSRGSKAGTLNTEKDAFKSMDTILHALGRGTLKIWLRMLVRDFQIGEPDVVTTRRKA